VENPIVEIIGSEMLCLINLKVACMVVCFISGIEGGKVDIYLVVLIKLKMIENMLRRKALW